MRGIHRLITILSTIIIIGRNVGYGINTIEAGLVAASIVPKIKSIIGVEQRHSTRAKSKSKNIHRLHRLQKPGLPAIVQNGPLPGLPFVKVFEWMPKSPLATLPNGPAPLRPNTIGTIIAKQPQFSQLNTHLNLLGIHSHLLVDPSQNLTLFAPIDVAFDRLSPNAQRLLLGPNYFNRAMMGFTLAGLLVPTKIPADSMKLDHQYDVPTLAGVSLQVARMGKANNSNSNSNSDNIHVEDAHVVGEPILTQNGIIYPIDQFVDPLADLNLSINDVSERMVDDLFHFSSNIKPNQTVII